MFYNKAKRLQYLGFDDFWFKLVGILVVSYATYFLFSNLSYEYTFTEKAIYWGISLAFSTIDWFLIRAIMILLRNKLPLFKDSVLRITLLFLGIVLSVIVMDYIGMLMISPLVESDGYNFVARSKALLSITLISIMTMAIYEAIYFYKRLMKSIQEEEQSKRAIVQAQLDVLRNQAQPHFFFNTLNTLRDIIDQNSKDDAKEFVDKLSDMYRFLLESGEANVIPLRDELKFAKAYIHIQSERFGDNLKLHWDIPEMELNKMIVPMSLQLLLENAIKHNVISKAKPLTISVVTENEELIVQNKIRPKSTKLPSTELGLKNIQERYRLISNASIMITNDANQFKVSLPLLKSSK